jgi:hypothetical protein
MVARRHEDAPSDQADAAMRREKIENSFSNWGVYNI